MTDNVALKVAAPDLAEALAGGWPEPCFPPSRIEIRTIPVAMRDGMRLATDLYLPPLDKAPCIAVRTPYGRHSDKLAIVAMSFARRGYAVLMQDCRGTGDSEPDSWDYYIYESEDGLDLVAWVAAQDWFDGFLGSLGGSYLGQTQWCMAMHPAMGAIAPEMSGLGIWAGTVNLHMFINSYAASVGKGPGKLAVPHRKLERLMLEETLAGGWFASPIEPELPAPLLERYPDLAAMPARDAQRALWRHYAALPSAGRAAFIHQARATDAVTIADMEAMPTIFGRDIAHDAHTVPSMDRSALVRSLRAPALMITGWYDWGLPDALATWRLLREAGADEVAQNSRLLITPSSHGDVGYREGMADHPELRRSGRTEHALPLLLRWFEACRSQVIRHWPRVTYYLMGKNEWRATTDWPPPEARYQALYLGPAGILGATPSDAPAGADIYRYDPWDPTPTVGGSIVSGVYPPGSVDVSAVQSRDDVLVYSTVPLAEPLTIVGPLKARLYVSSTATDTDFVVRLSDVFPDGRPIQLQSGILRARHRIDPPASLEPGHVYELDVDMWATANRFGAGHRIRIDISSSDFPRFDRHSNRVGPGKAVVATQIIHRCAGFPSHVMIPIVS
jgi:predicted acyl esterase